MCENANPIDYSQVLDRLGSRTAAETVIKLYGTEVVKQIASLKRAIENASPAEIKFTAHMMVGSASIVSADRIHDIAEQIETAADELDVAKQLICELETQVAVAVQWTQDRLEDQD